LTWKPKWLKPFFLTHALIEQREIEVSIRNKNRGSVGLCNFFHIESGIIKVRQPFGVGGVKRDMADGIAGFLRSDTKVLGSEIDQIVI